MLSFLLRRQTLVCAIGLVLAGSTLAKPFVIKDIRVQGLQRVSAGTVFAYLPVKPGQTIDPDNAGSVISDLYNSHLFSDVSLSQDGSTLVVNVTEFPVISSIELKGNSALSSDAIHHAFSEFGFTEGQAYNPAMLNQMVDSLNQQYRSLNKYQVEITPQVDKLPRGRVAIIFNIDEGRTSRIANIQFVGNKVYSEETLRKLFDTTTTRWNSFFTKSDQLDGEKFDADLTRLENFYFDRGFLDFHVTSTQTSLADHKTKMLITVNVDEGQPYTLTGYELTGNFIVPKKELLQYVNFKTNTTYNRGEIQKTVEAIQSRLADEGYAQAAVNVVPNINRLTHEVSINLVVDPGIRYTVRHIIFTGNSKSYDTVMRREMRQQEMAPYSASDLQRSETRIKRLPQVQEMDKTLRPVPGHPDQVDIVYKIKERSTSYIQGGVGYGQNSGALFTIEYSDDNFMGSGDRLNVNFQKGSYYQGYGVSFTDPYLTPSGISIKYAFNYSKYDYDDNDLSDWTADNRSFMVTLGYPINEYNRLFFGGGIRQVKIDTGSDVAHEITEYLDKNGTKFNEYVVTGSWNKDTTNDNYFPSTGTNNTLYTEATTPGSDAKYYKIQYSNATYYDVTGNNSLIFDIHGKVNYGKGYGGDDDHLPFYRRYYAGGMSTIRGYSYGSVGPKYDNGDYQGGDFLTAGGIELMTPISFSNRASGNIRVGMFLDAGNVWSTADDFDISDLRYSTGVFMQWRSPIGPLNISYGRPLHKKPGDESESIQFTIGTAF